MGWRHPAQAVADLAAARRICVDSLADLPALDVRALRQLLAHAQSPAELWHLRAEVFRLLALHHSQAEAERRLALTRSFFAGRLS